ncbi:MAG: hypothetical protein K2M78_08375 [Lachnospiraceae bacterium]|nr:hypothetical protein [Lachnospiraceae bacterium]
MIELIKNNKSSFTINMDMTDVEDLINFIVKIVNYGGGEKFILHSGRKKHLEIQIDEEEDILIITKDFVRIYMDLEELEYLRDRLEKTLITRVFYPAEICERYYKEIYVTLYCNVVI